MPEMELVRTGKGIRGFGSDNDRAWGRFKGWLRSLGQGETFRVKYWRDRNPRFHRKFFALLNFLYDHWEPGELTYQGAPVQKQFEAFRKQVTILAGFYAPVFDLDGGLRLEAQSIAFENMEEETFEKLYKAVINLGITRILPAGYDEEELRRVLAEIERFDQ